MDNNISRFDPGLNPMSRQFLSRATDNMAAQMNTVRTQDDMKPDEQEEAHQRDIADLAFLDASTVTPEEGFEAASYGGELGELTDDLVEDDGEEMQELQSRAHHEEAKELKKQGGMRVKGEADVHADVDRDLTRRSTQDKLAQIRAEVPDEIWAASASMIEGQMVGQTPKAGLIQMKSIPEPGQLEMTHAGYEAEPLDITDRKTGPLPAHVDDAA